MNIEFHYYITYIIARSGGFTHKQSLTLSQASQLLDDLTDDVCIKNSQPGDEPDYMVSATSVNSLFLTNQLVQERLFCFHFLPGNLNGDWPLKHKMLTTKNSFLANYGLKKSFASSSLLQIGIASHAYADSFAHHNFIGDYHSLNSGSKILSLLIPNIGHADFGCLPDIANAIWHDDRLLIKDIDNKAKILDCSKKLLKYYAKYNSVKARRSTIQDISALIGDKIIKGMFTYNRFNPEAYQQYILQTFDEKLPLYNKEQLLQNDEFLINFDQAAKSHKAIVWPFIKARLGSS